MAPLYFLSVRVGRNTFRQQRLRPLLHYQAILLFLSYYLPLEKLLEVPWMISEHIFSGLAFDYDMCYYNILKTTLVLFQPALCTECSAYILSNIRLLQLLYKFSCMVILKYIIYVIIQIHSVTVNAAINSNIVKCY